MTQQRAGKPAWGGNKGKQKLQGPEQNKSHFGTSCTGKKKKKWGEKGEKMSWQFSASFQLGGSGSWKYELVLGGGSI